MNQFITLPLVCLLNIVPISGLELRRYTPGFLKKSKEGSLILSILIWHLGFRYFLTADVASLCHFHKYIHEIFLLLDHQNLRLAVRFHRLAAEIGKFKSKFYSNSLSSCTSCGTLYDFLASP